MSRSLSEKYPCTYKTALLGIIIWITGMAGIIVIYSYDLIANDNLLGLREHFLPFNRADFIGAFLMTLLALGVEIIFLCDISFRMKEKQSVHFNK